MARALDGCYSAKDVAYSVLTPYYKENVLFSSQALEEQNEDGVSILFYLQKIYPDEWKNFLERVDCKSEDELRETEQLEDELRLWASYRGQTLTRTGTPTERTIGDAARDDFSGVQLIGS